MAEINWYDEVKKRENALISDTQQFLKIKSILDEENKTASAPFGKGIQEALQFLLTKGERDGFRAKNIDGLAGHIELGEGDELIGILCHVDVVPEGDGWKTHPFGAEIREGKIFARGALDDKGPTMAAYYAMKIVKELGLPLSKRVRIIIGTDEESNWRCVEHYFQHEEMPAMGFAPDADFPIIYAEKGIADFDICQTSAMTTDGELVLEAFEAGRRYNMVPDYAKCVISGTHTAQLKADFQYYLKENGLTGSVDQNASEIEITLVGVSAHGMEPKNGRNAGLLLLKFLQSYSLGEQADVFTSFATTYFSGDSRGENLRVSYRDEITGELTINVGIIRYAKDTGGKFGLNLRYPVTNDLEQTKKTIAKVCSEHHMVIENFSDSKPHHVDKEHVLIKTLQKVYEEQTGEKAALISIGGGTYARSLRAGVAFGPLFPGRPDCAHQKDEYIHIDDLLKATAIYAQAIYELAK